MAWYNNLFGGSLKLTTTDRQTIWRLFGSFRANQLEGNNSYLEQGYERNIDVYSVIKKIIETASSLEWVVEEQNTRGEITILRDTSIHELMDNPNITKGYTWNDIQYQIILYLLCTGNGYIVGNTQIGRTLIEELDILPSNLVTPYSASKDWFMPEPKYIFEIEGKKRVLERERVAHIKYFNPSYQTVSESLLGLSPIQVAARAVQVGNDRWDADANLLQNRGAVGLISDKSSRPLTPEEADKLQSAFDVRTTGTAKFGKTVVTNKDLNYIQMAMSSADLQLVEKGVITLRSICNVFGLDSSLFNDPANKTFNNRKEAEKALYTNAVMPVNEKIAAILNRWLVKNHLPNRNVWMRPDYSGVASLQEDMHEKARTLSLLKTSGILTANQALERLGEEASEDENADKLIVSSSSTIAETLPNLERRGNENE